MRPTGCSGSGVVIVRQDPKRCRPAPDIPPTGCFVPFAEVPAGTVAQPCATSSGRYDAWSGARNWVLRPGACNPEAAHYDKGWQQALAVCGAVLREPHSAAQ